MSWCTRSSRGGRCTIGIAVPHQGHAEDHRVGRAVGGAEREQQRAHVHVAEGLALLDLYLADLLGERLERVAGVGQARDRRAADLPLVAGQAAHHPAAVAIDHILHAPRRIVRVRHEPIPLHRHPPPLRHGGGFSLRPQRLLPDGPQGVEHLLVEVGRKVGLREQELEPASPAPGRFVRRGSAGHGAAQHRDREADAGHHHVEKASLASAHSDVILGR